MSEETQVADPTEVISTEPVVVSDGDASVISEHGQQVDADLTWDNIEEAAPSLADANEDGEVKDDWDRVEDQAVEATAKADSEDKSESDEVDDGPKLDAKEDVEEDGEPDGEETPSKEVLKLEDMPDDTKIMAKVDGELQEVTIKEFKNGISGEKAIAKRFTEFDAKEKEFNAEMENVNNYINELGTTMKSSSVLEGMTKVGELTGIPSYQLKEALIKELLPEIERRYSLDDNELQLEYQQQENDYLKNKQESDNVNYKAEQAQRDLDAKVSNIRETHNINDEEWSNAISTLDANLDKDKVITPELVSDYVNFKRAENRADSIINAFDPKYAEDATVMDALVDEIFGSPNLTDEDFTEILTSALGKSKKEEAEAKVDALVEKKEAKVVKKKDEPQFEELTDWDD